MTMKETKTITFETARRILELGHIFDYGRCEVVATYENGFKAIQTNEWCKTEIYCEVYTDDLVALYSDVYNQTNIVSLVVERYK